VQEGGNESVTKLAVRPSHSSLSLTICRHIETNLFPFFSPTMCPRRSNNHPMLGWSHFREGLQQCTKVNLGSEFRTLRSF
jgi:hypothetical protein